jgi:hypothetical protein
MDYREQDQAEGYFDHKTVQESQAGIRERTEDVLRGHQRAVKRNLEVAFHLD